MDPNRMNKSASMTIHVISDGSGATGRHLAQAAILQFPGYRAPIAVRNNITDAGTLEAAVKAAAADGAIVVHTLVEAGMRSALVRLCRELEVEAVDLMGPLLRKMRRKSGVKPVARPGLYREERKDYFDLVDGIDFSLSHDDGSRPEDLPEADIVIVGVSRCGKTPLSMYLAAHGWKVANVPFVHGIPLPDSLSRVDRRRVFGLLIDFERLLAARTIRDRRLGHSRATAYSDPSVVLEEIEAARQAYRRGGFHVIDVTDKPVESTSAEIVRIVTGAQGGALRAPAASP
jgi:regulator of PEP synthase PpsR (kinase-PPPase family)